MQSTYYLESLQTSIASILRDIELEEFEHWDYLDHLGVLSNSGNRHSKSLIKRTANVYQLLVVDFPIPDLPEALLSSFFVEEMDKFSGEMKKTAVFN